MLSPMMQQYMETKNEYPGCILFYRLGDFYEMFFEDAQIGARELELTLTGKDCGLEERAPMCGVPHHAVDSYIYKLVSKGYKVAIAEQLEDPKIAKGIVKRDVIRVVTPGTITGSNELDELKNNYLCSIAYIGGKFGICMTDITTGDFKVTETDTVRTLYDELQKFRPVEILCNKELEMSGVDLKFLKDSYTSTINVLDDNYFSEQSAVTILTDHYKVQSVEGLGLAEYASAELAAGAALRYLYDTQKHNCSNITDLTLYQSGEYMIIDASTRRNLELTETMRNKERKGTLLWVLDKTGTAMGARLLRSYIEQPLVDIGRITARQDAIEKMLGNYIDREELREYIKPVYDLERLMSRISSGLANPRDIISLKSSVKMLGPIRNVLASFDCELLNKLYNEIDPLDDIYELIDRAIIEEPPVMVHEGNIIKPGYNEDVDKLRNAKTEGKTWLAELEARERERTGIKTLRVRYNKVFGYCIEITNAFKDKAPADYIRKQTLTTCERYTTDELKKLEDIILGAEDRLFSLEYELFTGVREAIASEVSRIQTTARAIAQTDVLASLAQVAYTNNYVRPKINDKGVIIIKDGRHPVVEKMLSSGKFIANDTLLDDNKNRFAIITGPNMAGKSTYMRQVALITLMAQIGSFVPASSADISICDRVFTRVGASDDLASGQSTFMVEMTEVANILRNATKDSLIIMDEIGRGTSTFDGLSIAWAVVEHISDRKLLGSKTLFATHYHELTELEGTLNGVQNYCIAVKEQGDNIAFLRKIVKGGADKSYGIQVARLAGLPESVLRRAKELVEELSNSDIAFRAKEIAELGIPEKSRRPIHRQNEVDAGQLSLFETTRDDDIISEISNLDISTMTPIDALNELYKLQNTVNNRVKL
ncbi:MAG: DNA mismatch repair protein MutS [Lachnospiraceae bacterium]|nr:DNA mismatch repair protein MutS [Lachnospiraceae bacterium]